MYIATAKIDGMMCGMCEAHVNDAIRGSLQVENVTSSHSKGETVISSQLPITEKQVEKALAPTGYRVVSFAISEGAEKRRRGLFGRRSG